MAITSNFIDKENAPFVEFCKVLAGFLAIIMTSLSALKYYEWPIDSPHMVVLTWFHVIGTACVPLFLISVGYVLIYQKLTFKYYYQLIYFLITYWILGVFLYVFNCLVTKTNFDLGECIVSIFNYTVSPCGWYVEIYIGLYLLIPLLNNLWNFTTLTRDHILIIIILFILCCLPSITNTYDKIFPTYYEQLYPLFYYLVGGYLRTELEGEKREKSYLKQGIFIALAVSLISLIQNVTILYDVKFEDRVFNQYFSYPACFIALGLFFMAKKINFSNWIIKINHYVSRCILWVVLCSSVLLKPIYNFINEQTEIHNLNAVVIFSVALGSFVISCFVFCVICYIFIKLKNKSG